MLPLCKFSLHGAAAAAAEQCCSRRGVAHPAPGYLCQGSLCRTPAPSCGTGAQPTPASQLLPAPAARVTLDSFTPSSVLSQSFEHLFIRSCRIWAQGIPSPPAPRGCSQPKGPVTNIPALRDDQSWAVLQAGRSLPFRNMFNLGRSRNRMFLRASS